MYGLILTLHILVAISLMIVVLIQQGKAGMGGLFGGGSSEALFSAPSGTVFIRKLTVGLAVAFFSTTIILTFLQGRKSTRSVIQRVGVPSGQQQP
jgi:preprotein translocase subunit SecG